MKIAAHPRARPQDSRGAGGTYMPQMCMCASALRRDHRSRPLSRRDGGGGDDRTGGRSAAAAARQREPDAAATTPPGRSAADGRCNLALEAFRKNNGNNLIETRAFLIDALARSNVHRPTVFRAWVSMEEQARTDARSVRKLFVAWSRAYGRKKAVAGGGGEEEEEQGWFWCLYIDFELRRGTAASVRVVSERALLACPRDPAVHAKYANAELRLVCPDRAGDVLSNALDLFAGDANTRKWLEHEVGNSLSMRQRHGIWRRLRERLLPFRRRRSGLPTAYKLLSVE